MSTAQTWDPVTYARNARFVSDLGSPVVELLGPKPGERILDLGCGDGVLTKKLADLGCEVLRSIRVTLRSKPQGSSA
jgi:2-polyprenyl-3-methyl-5-hydroxy-6-metoxy-1,4-benzoquinol methylase